MDKASNKSDVDFVYENKGTYGEWQSTCTTWNKPSSSPARSMDSLSQSDVDNKVVVCYSLNTDPADRDFALIKPVGSSTPVEGEYFWVSGANPFLDDEFPTS